MVVEALLVPTFLVVVAMVAAVVRAVEATTALDAALPEVETAEAGALEAGTELVITVVAVGIRVLETTVDLAGQSVTEA